MTVAEVDFHTHLASLLRSKDELEAKRIELQQSIAENRQRYDEAMRRHVAEQPETRIFGKLDTEPTRLRKKIKTDEQALVNLEEEFGVVLEAIHAEQEAVNRAAIEAATSKAVELREQELKTWKESVHAFQRLLDAFESFREHKEKQSEFVHTVTSTYGDALDDEWRRAAKSAVTPTPADFGALVAMLRTAACDPEVRQQGARLDEGNVLVGMTVERIGADRRLNLHNTYFDTRTADANAPRAGYASIVR